MAPLPARLADLIRDRGPLAFDVFMEHALYDPHGGYYARRRPTEEVRAGATGDFITAPTLTPFFGAALAGFVQEVWERLGRPDRWCLVEVAGGTGALMVPLLQQLLTDPQTGPHAGLQVILVDRDPVHRERAAAAVATMTEGQDGSPQVRIEDVLPPLGGPTVLIANELLDNLPVRVIATDEQGDWHERRVDHTADERFVWKQAAVEGTLQAHVESIGHEVPILHQAEVPVGAWAWLEAVDRACPGPLVALIVDYGLTSAEAYCEPRHHGTLTGYRGHERVDDVLAAPGTCDITAHVDFTAVGRYARSLGWSVLGHTTQGALLMDLGIVETAARLAGGVDDEASWARLEAVKQLFLPGGMGERFRVMLLGKGIRPLDFERIRGFTTNREWDPRPRS